MTIDLVTCLEQVPWMEGGRTGSRQRLPARGTTARKRPPADRRAAPVPMFRPSGAWCLRRDSNPRPQDSYHFDFRRCRERHSWSGLSLHPRLSPLGAALPVSTPSGRSRLGSGSAPQELEKRSPNLSRSTAIFRSAAPNFQPGILCSILLSYADVQTDDRP